MQPGLPSLQLVIESKSPTEWTLYLLFDRYWQRFETLCTKIFSDIRTGTSNVRMRASGSHGTTQLPSGELLSNIHVVVPAAFHIIPQERR